MAPSSGALQVHSKRTWMRASAVMTLPESSVPCAKFVVLKCPACISARVGPMPGAGKSLRMTPNFAASRTARATTRNVRLPM